MTFDGFLVKAAICGGCRDVVDQYAQATECGLDRFLEGEYISEFAHVALDGRDQLTTDGGRFFEGGRTPPTKRRVHLSRESNGDRASYAAAGCCH